MLHLDAPPLDPSSPEAREWLVDELSRPGYSAQPGPLERLWEWFLELLRGIRPGGAGASWLLWVLVAVAAVVLTVILVSLLRPARRRSRGAVAAVLDASGRTAAQFRRDAAAALARGDADAALLDAVRAIAAGATERVILEESPGRTAQELAQGLAPAFPTHTGALHEAMGDFDRVRYADSHATLDQARRAIDLDATLARTSPARPLAEAVP